MKHPQIIKSSVRSWIPLLKEILKGAKTVIATAMVFIKVNNLTGCAYPTTNTENNSFSETSRVVRVIPHNYEIGVSTSWNYNPTL